MKLDVSATRHPLAASRLLVSVQDQDGPISQLAARDFEVFMWPSLGIGGFTRTFPVDEAAQVGAPGFYSLRLDAARTTYGDEPETFATAEDLGAVVFGVV